MSVEDTTARGYKQPKASVYVGDDDVPFIVTETPSEIAVLVENAESTAQGLIQLTLGNRSDWNGKPLFVRAAKINAISAPKTGQDNDDDS